MTKQVCQKVGVIGSGAWGTALALTAACNVSQVLIYCRDEAQANEINQKNIHPIFPDITLPQSITAISSLLPLQGVDLLLLVVPTQAIREVLLNMLQISESWPPLLICAKGIERDTNMLLTQVVASVLPKAQVAVLAGPNFAYEIAHRKLSATVVASLDKDLGQSIVKSLESREFRVCYSNDPVGLQLLGAAKNVYAIATGIAEGMQLGENAKAAIITSALLEMSNLCTKFGGKLSTVLGLGGVGDVVLSCSTRASRNMDLGCRIGKGEALASALGANVLHEGYFTTKGLYHLAQQLQIDTPLLSGVYDILYQGMDKETAVEKLLQSKDMPGIS